MAFNICDLTTYVEEQRFPLIRKAVIGAKSAKLFNLQTGVKGSTALNLLDTTVAFGDGSSCGWNEAGTSKLSQRVIVPGYPKVNMAFCDKTLLKTYLNHDVRVAAGQKSLPFAEEFYAGVVENVAAAIEVAIWQGDASIANTNVNTNKFDGIIKIAEDSSLAATVTYDASASVSEIVNDVYAALPDAVFSKPEVVLFMGSDVYRKYVQELIANGNMILNAGAGAVLDGIALPESILIPATNVRVYGVDGLSGTGKMFASYKDNFVYGTDMQGDEEKFEAWYSQDNREFRLAIELSAGTQIAYPDLVVEAKAE